MPRKQSKQPKRPKYTPPTLPITKLDNVPGPEADATTLNAHFQQVRDVFATRQYDDIIQTCHWCLDMEAGLAYSKPDSARGTRMFCSARCANAHGAYLANVLNIHRKAQDAMPPDSDDEATDNANEAPLPPEPEEEQVAMPPAPADDEGDGTPLAEVTETVGEERPGRATWKPTKERGRKARKPRAAKAPRTDGKCSKGLHEMTPENTYEYNGTVWCKECRKASRAKSKNGGSK